MGARPDRASPPLKPRFAPPTSAAAAQLASMRANLGPSGAPPQGRRGSCWASARRIFFCGRHRAVGFKSRSDAPPPRMGDVFFSPPPLPLSRAALDHLGLPASLPPPPPPL